MRHNDIYTATRLSNGPEGLDRYSGIFSKNGDPRDDEVLHWRFQNNPGAAATHIFFAEDTSQSNEEAAIYAVMDATAFVDGQTGPCAQSLDTLTDSGHRRQGLFPWLAKETYDSLREDGHQFVYGFPNGNSVHTFRKKLDWTILDPVPFLLKPLKTGYFLKRALPGPLKWLGRLNFSLTRASVRKAERYDIAPIANFDESHDRLWSRFRAQAGCGIDRNSAYMNWRLIDFPRNENYRMLQASIDGEIVGEIAWTVEQKHGGSIGYVLEFLNDPEHPEAAEVLMQRAVRDIKDSGGDAILAWCNHTSPNYRHYKKAGFFNLPEKLRPIELHWGVLPFKDESASFLKQRDNWYISYLDSDTV